MNKILVPFDFSDVANNALDFAVQLASRASACEVTLYHVVEHPSEGTFKTMGISDYDPMEVLYLKKLIEQVEQKMAKALSKYDGGKVTVNSKIRLGNPDRQIIEEAENEKIDLIVMGTGGAEGLQEFFEGSYSEKVVRHASCPVITVRGAAKAEIIREIVFASDFEEINEDFIGHLKSLRRVLDARLRIVKINTPASFAPSRWDNELMDKFIKKHDLGNCTTEIYNFSNEEDGIIAYAEDIGAQMIALGTHQLKGAKHFLKGSIAEDVVNHAKVPVWTYHLKK
jgi:nucleotide-binding universal stress UspA family protein